MNYDKQKIEAGPSSETQRAESVANKFFDMAEKGPGTEDQKTYEMFSGAGRETAQGNYTQAQHILESGVDWNDDLRASASEINQLDQERAGAKPMTIEDVQNTISKYARDFEKMSKEKGGKTSDLEASMDLDNISSDISESGPEGIDNALDYLEGTLKSKANIASSIPPEDRAAFLKDWQEKRAMRDALFQEKQKRIEQQKQSQQATEEIDKGRTSASRNLENLYAQAGVPEETPSRQEFLTKVSRMSPDELHFLDNALKKTAAEFGRTRDPKQLDARLADLVSKSFKPEDVTKRQKAEDQRKIEEIRRSLNLPEQQSIEPASTREMSGQEQVESEVKNPFQTLAESPDTYRDRLQYEEKPNTYNSRKAVGTVIEVFRDLYPDKKQLVNRMEDLFGQYTAVRDKSRAKKPEKEESSHESFAINQITRQLSDTEREALKKAITEKINITQRTSAGEAQHKFTQEAVFGDFIRFLEDIKQ
tara:strand:+ start:2902 stop:4335 length:1434 start_codon:yes stop_codon:yes gene_type:complete